MPSLGTGQIPYAKSRNDWAGHLLGNWSISGVYQAQTGGNFTVYDGSTNAQCVLDGTNFCYPVLAGAVPGMTDAPVAGSPNTFTLYSLGSAFQTQQQFCASDPSPLACTARLNHLTPELLSPRNLFRTPGVWNMDVAILKDFRLPWEGKQLQFRAEFFNLFNHSNLYADERAFAHTKTSWAPTEDATSEQPMKHKERQSCFKTFPRHIFLLITALLIGDATVKPRQRSTLKGLVILPRFWMVAIDVHLLFGA